MKTSPLLFLATALILVGATSCSHIEIKPEGDPDRVLTGSVNFSSPELPPNSVVTVRLLNVGEAGAPANVLGEQKIENPGPPPVPFKIEYYADDSVLRRGLQLEARIAVGGKLRFYNVSSHVVTLSNATDPHEIWVNAIGGE